MDHDSINYFRMREETERAAAEAATCPEARRAHDELARGYAALIRQASEPKPQLTVVPLSGIQAASGQA